MHAPQAILLAPLGGQVFRVVADQAPARLPGHELSPPDEWMDCGELKWLSQGGALLGLLWSQEPLPETAPALLNLLLRSAQDHHDNPEAGLLLTHLPAPVAWLGADLRFRQVSRHFLKLHQLQQQDVLGSSVAEVFPARTQLPGLLERALAGQAVCLPLEGLRLAAGRTLWVRGEARPYFDAQGVGVLWTSQDASEERGLARQLDSLLDDSGVMMAIMDQGGVVQNASSALMALGGHVSGQGGQIVTGPALLGTPLWDWPSWTPEARAEIKRVIVQAARGESASTDVRPLRGGLLQLSVHGDGLAAGAEADGDLAPSGSRGGSAGSSEAVPQSGVLIAEVHDLSALRELQEQSALQRSLISEILARSSEATLIVNVLGKVTLANEEAAGLLGIDAQRLTGSGLGKLLRDMGVQLFGADMQRLDYSNWARESMPPDQEVTLVNAVGEQRMVRVGIHLLPSLEGQRSGLMMTLRDITALRRMEARLRHDTQHDALTGLLNRAGLRGRLLALGAGTAVSVLALDVNGFASLTAALGRVASDSLLVHLAARLVDWRPGALVARLSNDLFVLAAEQGGAAPDKSGLEEDLKAIQHHLRTPLRLSGRDLPLGFHLGAAGGLVGGDPEGLLAQAETALGYVKQEGVNQGDQGQQGTGVVYQEAMRAEVARSFQLESELPAALLRGELTLNYQPIISLTGVGNEGPINGTPVNKVLGAEALLRWNHPKLGLLAPPAFLGLASRSAVISDIGELVVAQALAARTQWRKVHPDMQVSVNLSLDELLRQDDLERLFPLMEQHGPPDFFELSAGSLVEYSERTAGLLDRLTEMGARILVDDFGDGASSLSSLERFPLAGIKLHPSFVGRLHHPRAYKLLSATTALAGSLGLSVTAVGVETAEQLGMLRKAGVTAAQGYYFAAPMSAEELAGFRVKG